MKIFYYIILLLLLPSTVLSQASLNWYWAEASGGTATRTLSTGVAADSSGNVFVTGWFNDNNVVFGTDTLYNFSEGYIFFIVKYSPAGNVLWAKAPAGGNEIFSYSVATDAGGNAYITGGYYGGFILGEYALPNTPNNDVNSFIAKYDTAGNVLWAKASTGPPGNNNNYGYSIAIDRNGNSYSTGNFSGDSVSFGGYTLYNNNADAYSLYVVKYNSAGNVLWAESTSGNDEAYGIAVDGNNNAYITGFFITDSVRFGNNTIYHNYSFGESYYFIAKYDSSGNAIWAEGASDNGAFCEGFDLATDRENNIYVTGYLSGTFNFGGPVTLSGPAGPGNPTSAFIVKYNDSGNAIWGKASGGQDIAAKGTGIATDANNNIYATGIFGGGILPGFDSTIVNFSGSPLTPIYIFTFDSSGDLLCASALNNGNADVSLSQKLSICTDKNGNAYISSDFDGGNGNEGWNLIVGSDTLITASSATVFVAKFMCSNCLNADTFTYQLAPAVLCPGDSARISFGNYSQLSISPGSHVSWSDSLHATLKPDSTTVYTINGYLACGGYHSQSFTLPVANGTVAVTTNANTICVGDSTQICAAPGYSSYHWSPASGGAVTRCIEAKNTGSYSVTATENTGGCTANSSPLNITVDEPQVSITASPPAICPGDSSKICAPSNFIVYDWSNNTHSTCFYAKSNGTYSVTVVDNNGCAATSTPLSLSTGQAPSVSITANTDSICPGDSTQICATSAFTLYRWSTNATTNCIEAKNTGAYYLIATNNNGCSAQSNSITLTQSANCAGQNQPQSCTAYSADTAQGQIPVLWGLTWEGGTYDDGVIFNLNTTGNAYTNLYSFETNIGGLNKNGAAPQGNLIQAANGLLYGMAELGGANNYGVIFSLNPCANTYTSLYSFANNGSSGASPYGSLVQAANGLLYGMTAGGGASGEGVIFSFNPANNTYTNLYSFAGGAGSGNSPYGNLIQASNGLLYGMTQEGGANDVGVIFSFNPATNTYTNLYSFTEAGNGYQAHGSLVQAANGLLYGMTLEGGTDDGGVIFSFNPTGNIYTDVYNFVYGGNNGYGTYGGLVQAANGLLYGMTLGGGTNGIGVIFSFNAANNAYTDLYNFADDNGSGAQPYGNLVQAGNGLLYGMTGGGGIGGVGVVYSFNPATNSYINLYSFARDSGSGAQPYGSLLILAMEDTVQNQPLNCNTFKVTITAPDTITCPGGAVPLGASTNAGGGGTYYDTLNMRSHYNLNWDSGTYPMPGPFGASPGLDTLGGVPFTLSCATCHNTWAAEYAPGANPIILSLPVAQKNIDSVFALVNTTWGSNAGPYAAIQLWAGGANVFQKNLWGDTDIRDYNNSVYTNTINNTSTINVYLEAGVGRRLDMMQLAVPANLYNTKIDSILFVDNGAENLQRMAVTGVTLKIADTGGVNYSWSTGSTASSINVTPQQTTVYTVTATASGCTATASVNITVHAPILSITTADSVLCNGDSTQICASAGYATYTWSPAIVGTTGSCIEAKNNGSYHVIATSGNGCTVQSNTINISVGQLSVIIGAVSDSICPGDSALICANGNFSSYNWSNNGSTQCIEAKNVGLYTLTVTDNPGGCMAQSNSVRIYAGQAPSVTISASPDSICSGESAQICPNANFTVYAWSNNASSHCIEAQNTGLYTLTITDSHGCTAQSNSLRVYPGQAPSVTINANTDTICAGDSAQICSSANFSTYTWSNNGASQCIKAPNPGLYTLTVTNNAGCTAQSNSITIYAGQSPIATVSANKDSICPGDSARLCATGNFLLYIWNNRDTTLCMETQTPGAYFLRAADANGCSAQSNSVVISAAQVPSVTISANTDSICSGDSAQICAGSNFATYLWSPPFGGQGTGACIEARNQGSYYLIASGNNGCMAQSNSVNISVRQLAAPTLTANQDSICTGDSAQICVMQGFATYAWNPAIGGAAANCIQAHNPGAYSVAVSDNNGCTAQSNPLSIVVMQIPTVNITAASDSICTGDSAQLCATQGFAIYSWSPPFGGQGACIEAHSTGTFNVTVTDNHSCTAQSSPVNITVGNTLTTTITTNADSICTGDTAKICAPPGFATYNWNPATGGTTANCIRTTSTGNYYVSVSDNSGCSAQSNTVSITALQSPTAIITANPPSFCPGSSAQICATAGYATYRWTYNNNNSNCIEVQRADNYAVTVTDNNGCTAASNPIGITLQSAPPVAITAQPENICPGDSSKICAPPGFEAYLWNTNANTNCIHTAAAGSYNLTVTDLNGCTALSNHISINVYPKPSVAISTGLDTICPGDSTKICAPSTLTFTAYLWNSPFGGQGVCIEAQNAGDYYVTVTDNVGCTAESNHVSITTLPIPQVSISRIGDTLIANNAINCQWYFNNTLIQDATQNIYIAHNNGSYTVSVTDSDGCNAFSSPILFTGTGVDNISEGYNILVYPNPLSVGKWQMAVSNNFIGAQLEILDDNGRIVYKSEIKTTHSEIEAPFAGGVYLLRVVTGEGIVTRKLVKL